jgi:hypothetical protein
LVYGVVLFSESFLDNADLSAESVALEFLLPINISPGFEKFYASVTLNFG